MLIVGGSILFAVNVTFGLFAFLIRIDLFVKDQKGGMQTRLLSSYFSIQREG